VKDAINIEYGRTDAMVSQVGGTVMSFSGSHGDVFFPWRMVGKKARGGCPICAPWFGSSPRGPKKHGYLRDLEATECMAGGTNVVDLVFNHPGDEGYPWAMRYDIRTSVRENELFVFLEIARVNNGIANSGILTPAPILPAFHPYFACQDAEAVRVLVGEDEYRGFSEDARAVPLSSHIVLIEMPERQIRMKLEGAFPLNDAQLVLWTDAPNEYVCVEPVFGNKELFDTPNGRHVRMGMPIKLSMSISVNG